MALDLKKSYTFFQPEKVTDPVHIIGIGAIGSTLAVMLARIGMEKLYVYDFDTVSTHNIANQQYRYEDVGARKVDALTSILKEINPKISVNKTADSWTPKKQLSVHVFMCVDNMKSRNEIMRHCSLNPQVVSVYDFRMGLTDAQHYAATTASINSMNKMLKSMQHTDEEAKKNVPVSACNTELSIMPTIATVVSVGVANFINHINGQPLAEIVMVNPFSFITEMI